MDDLDHSMNIAEFDWSSFYDESEECVSLPQPALARPDDLSDSDDSLDSSSVFSSGSSLQGAPQDAKEADSGVTESDCAGRLNESGAEGAQVTAGNTEVRLENVEDVTEARGDVTETLSVECSEASITRDEPSPLNVKEPHTARAEKERWFVTVDYRPVRPRGKKKRRQKKTCRQEKPPEEEEEEEDAVGGRASFTESNQELSRTSGRHQREENFSEDENEPKPGRSHDTFTSKALAQAESAESDEFSSVHSCDSESYVTAAESAEEARHRRPVDLTRLQSSSASEVRCFLSGDVAAVNRDGNEDTADARRALTFPSAGADADSTCDDINTHSAVQKHDINPLSRGSCSSGDRLGPVPDSPDAAGLARPVFAISAFWNDMEKVTINDILQLRMSRGTATEHADEPSHSSPVELSDSDYFTQPDESKPERSSCEFSTSDVEEDDDEYWQFVGASRNASTPGLQGQERPERTSESSLLSHEEEDDESTSSEGTQTPVPLEDFAQESHTLSTLAWSGQMTKSKSTYDVQVLNKDDDVRFGRYRSVNDETAVLKDTLAPGLFLSGYDTDVLDEHFPEVFECFFTEDKTNNNESGCITVYNPDELSVAPVFDYSLCPPRDDVPPRSFLHDSLYNEDKPIPIFSCSPPTIREMTFPNSGYVFLEEADDFSPIRVVSCSFVQADQRATQRGSYGWKTFLNTRKIGFHARGSIWGRTSGSWMFPPDSGKAEGKVFAFPQVFGELQPSILETKKTARQEGIFSTLKQSDMCLVCIAFASWVLRSSDPENADTWKAALLANVSALSAIQYLRHYVKRRPRQDDA